MASERLSFDDPGIPAERQYYSVGYVAQMFNLPPHLVGAMAREAGVGPCYACNGVPHFDGKAVERMAEHIKLNLEHLASTAATTESK